jgi:putative transcriptional regulator
MLSDRLGRRPSDRTIRLRKFVCLRRPGRPDATDEAEIDQQRAEDNTDALRDAARFARRVRRRLGFSQAEFAKRIGVSLDTIRNWEQGKRHPTGAAKVLLRILDKAPEAALAAWG